jgi:hypothetical protein
MVKGFTVVASEVVKASGIHQVLLQSGRSTSIVWQIDKVPINSFAATGPLKAFKIKRFLLIFFATKIILLAWILQHSGQIGQQSAVSRPDFSMN